MNESALLERCLKLSPKTGDVFVLAFEAGNTQSRHLVQQAASLASESLRNRYGADVFFLVLPSDMPLREASEAEMNAAGWFRADPCSVVEKDNQ